MRIETLYPSHPVLKKYIEYYYFVKTDDPDFEVIFYAFPHIFQSLNIHKHTDYKINDCTKKLFESRERTYLSLIHGKIDVPYLIHLAGKLDKLSIIFKPLGMNQFIRKPFNVLAPHSFNVFREWDKDSRYNKFLFDFYATDDSTGRIALLEAFLMTQYQPLPENRLLQEIIDELTDFDRDMKVSDIARKHFIEEKTFTRFFKKHLGFTPVSFKKVARFRHSLKNRLLAGHPVPLTQVGYKSNFYDQSYFVRVYKQLTNENPSSFFRHVNQLTDQLYFRFLKDNA